MKPVVLSDLEAHLIAMHNVDPVLISLLEEKHPEKRPLVASTSHMLMHVGGLTEETTPHTHPDFEDGGNDDGEVLHQRLAHWS